MVGPLADPPPSPADPSPPEGDGKQGEAKKALASEKDRPAEKGSAKRVRRKRRFPPRKPKLTKPTKESFDKLKEVAMRKGWIKEKR